MLRGARAGEGGWAKGQLLLGAQARAPQATSSMVWISGSTKSRTEGTLLRPRPVARPPIASAWGLTQGPPPYARGRLDGTVCCAASTSQLVGMLLAKAAWHGEQLAPNHPKLESGGQLACLTGQVPSTRAGCFPARPS